MKQTLRQAAGRGGFTKIEIVAVLLILAIISAVAITRITDRRTYNASSQLEVVKAHLRLSQARSMSSGISGNSTTYWGIYFNNSTTYYLFNGTNTSKPLLLLGEDKATVDLAAENPDLTISSAPQRITFNNFGSPGNSTVAVGTSFGSITITKKTGFIP